MLRSDEYIPVVIYNSLEKSVMGIFSSMAIANRFIYGIKRSRYTYQYIYEAMNRNGCVNCDQFPFKIAIRKAQGNYLVMLGNEEFIIMDEKYREFTRGITKFFKDTRMSLYKKHVIDKYNMKP